MGVERQTDGRLRQRWHRVVASLSWTRPTSTEIGVVVKSGIAAGVAWSAARLIIGVEAPVLASLTALVVVQVSVRASVMAALQRSAAVVLGVFLAVAIGNALGLNALSVSLLVIVTLGFAELVLRLPRPAARQVPISALVVLTALGSTPQANVWERALDTIVGAAVGVVITFVLPASRVVDARQTLDRLGAGIAEVLEAMGAGLREEWSVDQTEEWRRRARTARERLVRQAAEAVGNGREASRWNLRDRRHVAELGRYEQFLPRLERIAIGAWVIARNLDDQVRSAGTSHRSMAAMGELLAALAGAVSGLVDEALDRPGETDLAHALEDVSACRDRCVIGAARRARVALDHEESPGEERLEAEWLSYAALLVQVDRLVNDLSTALPS